MTFDEIIDAECDAESKIRAVLLSLEELTGMRLSYVRVICPAIDVDVSLQPRENCD